VDDFVFEAKRIGKDITLKLENELTQSDADGVDLIIALGSDQTYLRASSMARNNSVPLLGIDTKESFNHGHLLGNFTNNKNSK
jgi:NAD kinase